MKKQINKKDMQIKKLGKCIIGLEQDNIQLEHENDLCAFMIVGMIFLFLSSLFFMIGYNKEETGFDANKWCETKIAEYYPEFEIINVWYYSEQCNVRVGLHKRNGFVEESEVIHLSIIDEEELDMIKKYKTQSYNRNVLFVLGWAFCLLTIGVSIGAKISHSKFIKRGKNEKIIK